MNRCALNFRSLLGVLRTWMGERPRAETGANYPEQTSGVQCNGPSNCTMAQQNSTRLPPGTIAGYSFRKGAVRGVHRAEACSYNVIYERFDH
jgi:hypothetical protein